jgi:hypothetical protein
MFTDVPLGEEVAWQPVTPPDDAAPCLFSVSHAPSGDPAIWTYLPDGPYESRTSDGHSALYT